MASLIKPRVTPLEAALKRLTSGHGSQRLPAGVKSIEVQNVPSRGTRKGQRAFLKTVLPRVKYYNDQLDITTQWRKIPDRKKKGGKESDANQAAAASTSSDSVKSTLKQGPLIRLHYDALPAQDLPMGNKSVTDITREMLTMIHTTIKTPLEEEIPASQESVGEVEEGAIEATHPETAKSAGSL